MPQKPMMRRRKLLNHNLLERGKIQINDSYDFRNYNSLRLEILCSKPCPVCKGSLNCRYRRWSKCSPHMPSVKIYGLVCSSTSLQPMHTILWPSWWTQAVNWPQCVCVFAIHLTVNEGRQILLRKVVQANKKHGSMRAWGCTV